MKQFGTANGRWSIYIWNRQFRIRILSIVIFIDLAPGWRHDGTISVHRQRYDAPWGRRTR